MFTRLSVDIPQALMLALLQHLANRRGACTLDRAAADALQTWLSAQTGAPPSGPVLRGYQWKTLFLPEGTCLRSWSYGEHNYARVIGDEIIHEGKSVTPNQFARSFARTERNAWRDLYIKRPEDKKYQLAGRLRKLLLEQEAPEHENNAGAGNAEGKAVHTCQAAPPARAQPSVPQGPVSRPEPRCTEQMPGWDLPERRKWRIRLEDFE